MVFLNVFFLFLSMLVISDAVCSDSEDETEKGQVLKTYSKLNPTVNAVFSPINFDQNNDSSFDSVVSNDYLGISLNMSSRSQILGISLENQIESEPLGMSFETDSEYSVQSPGTCQMSVFNSSSQIQLFDGDSEFFLNEETLAETGHMMNTAHYFTSTPVKQTSEAYTSDRVYLFSSSPVTPISNSLKSKDVDKIDNSTLSQPETDVDSMSLGVVPLNSSSNISEPTNSNIDCDMLADIRGIIPIKTSKEVRLIDSGSRDKILTKHTRTTQILKVLKEDCCMDNCMQSFKCHDIKSMRRKYWSKNPTERSQWLSDKLMEQADVDKSIRFLTERGIFVCQTAFIKIFNINKSVYYRKRRLFKQNVIAFSSITFRQRTTKYLTAMNWFEDYVTFHGDRMPHVNIVYLPYRTRKYVIFKQYRHEINSALKRSTFYRMWTASFPHVKIKEINSFSKCTKCSSLERRLEKTTNPQIREKLLQMRQDHNTRQMAERKYYYRKRDLAKAHPTRYLSLIIDGMDQSKTNLPHFVGRTAKSVNPGNQLTTHITGILAHGQQAFFSFLDWCQYPHDSNLTMNLLLGIIYKIAAMSGGKLPPILYIQADNCWRENKNKYVLSFCELLVHMKVFQEVHLSFLYVGHTHEDIDAGFSKIADSLRRNDAETIPELLDLLPNPSNLIWQYDIRNWLEPFIADVRKHTKPLHYKFTMDEVSNKIKLCYKSNQAGPWKISSSGMFMFNNKGEVELPKGVPKVSAPVFDKISVEKIESGINDWKCLFTDQIENHQFNWWKSRVNYMKKLRDDNQFMKREIIQKAVWYFDKLPKIRVTSDCLDDNNPPKEIEDMINQELIEHEIQITQKRKRKQSEQVKTKPDMKKQKKVIKGNKKNMTARRTIYCSYVYGYICQKKQIFYSIIQELIELISFFNLICYIHALLYLLWLFYLAVEQHMVSTATVQLCFIQNNTHALIC